MIYVAHEVYNCRIFHGNYICDMTTQVLSRCDESNINLNDTHQTSKIISLRFVIIINIIFFFIALFLYFANVLNF